MKLIIQIPAFNEEKTIEATLRSLPKKIDGITSIETLVIDDGSSDLTSDAARRAGANHVVRLLSHRGLSTAFSTGIDTALKLGADVIVNTDADNQYRGSDVAKIIEPIVAGRAEVVIGDRGVKNSPHMSATKRSLQQLGSWAVGKASGLHVKDVTSGFRAFSREAAFQVNVFNPFTYTLETIIQAGTHNLRVESVPVETNPATRPSRLYNGVGMYLRKSIVTIFRVSTVYRPLKTFFAIGAVLFILGALLGGRFLYYFFTERSTGHVQSLILSAVLLISGFQTVLIGLVADLISVNRRLSEDVLVRLRKLAPAGPPQRIEQPKPTLRTDVRPPRRERPDRNERGPRRDTPKPAAAEPVETQWVWLVDEAKIDDRAPAAEAPPVQPKPDRERPQPEKVRPLVVEGAEVEGSEESESAKRRRRRRRRPQGAARPEPLPHHRAAGRDRGDEGGGDDGGSEASNS